MDNDLLGPARHSRPLLRAVLVLFGVFLLLVVYAFAFEQTEVDLDKVEDEGRRQQLVRIIRSLAHPDIITYPEEETYYFVEIAVPCPEDGFAPAVPDTSQAYMTVEPACADTGTDVTVRGFNFEPGTRSPLSFIPNVEGIALKRADIEVKADGTFEVVIEIPDRPDEEAQLLRVKTVEHTGGWTWSNSARDTWDKITETVMLALMATTLGIAVGIPLSFFSARNLMRPIRSPLLSVGLFIFGIPAGGLGGILVARSMLGVGDEVFLREPALTAPALAGVLLLAWLLMRRLLAAGATTADTPRARASRVSGWLLFVILGLVALLLAGYLLLEADRVTDALGPFGFLAGFLAKIGDLITTFFTAVVAGLAALAGALGGSRIGHALNDHLPGHLKSPFRYLAGFLGIGVIAGGIGMLVDWLYEYNGNNPAIPRAAAVALLAIAGGLIAARLTRPVREHLRDNDLQALASVLGFLATVVGLAIGFALGIFLGTGMDFLADLVMDRPSLMAAVLVGGLLGLILAWVTRHLDALPSGMITYYLSRSLFNGIRSVEPLVMAIVFVVWVGLGPFAGSLALALHTVAALAKLYSEQVESILPGPLEAVTATGATRLQNVVYAVVPQIVPPYIAFTLYRWDINVRMSTIIGFAGGGGIGFLLQQNMNLLQYRAASVQMLAIAVVVSTLDFVSARVRERIV